MGGIWLIAIGMLSFAAVFYCIVWERMRPYDIGIRFSPLTRMLRDLALGYGLAGRSSSPWPLVACGRR